MSRRRRGPPERPALPLYSLTEYQARWLREARDAGAEGAYLPITAAHWGALVDGGCATVREVHRVGEATRSVSDMRPCEWTDHYLVPTAWGLELLARASRVT